MALNKFSSRITQPRSQGASQAMLYGTGLTPTDLQKPPGANFWDWLKTAQFKI